VGVCPGLVKLRIRPCGGFLRALKLNFGLPERWLIPRLAAQLSSRRTLLNQSRLISVMCICAVRNIHPCSTDILMSTKRKQDIRKKFLNQV
jgi:hypothetical protein